MSKEKWERLKAERECIAHGAEGMAHGLAAIMLHTCRSGGVYPRPTPHACVRFSGIILLQRSPHQLSFYQLHAYEDYY